MIDCSQVFGRAVIVSFQEFRLALAMGAECGRRGITLDMSMMRVLDPNVLSSKDKEYLNYLRSIGAIYDGTIPEKRIVRNSKEDRISDRSVLWYDVDKFTELGSSLFLEKEDGYHWSLDWALQTYGPKYISTVANRTLMSATLTHLLGYVIIGIIVGDLPPKKLLIHLNRMEVRSTYTYLKLYACMTSCENIKNFVELVFEEQRKELKDLDYFVLFESSHNAGLFKWHDMSVKVEAMKKHGIQVGSIVALYKRHRISDSNPAGCIKEAYIARIDDISNTSISYTMMGVSKTKEEQEQDYLEIDQQYRGMFSDMLKFSIPCTKETCSISDIGVFTYFYREELLLVPLDKVDVVEKLITIDGVRQKCSLNTVEAVYWILCQHDVDFDRDMYARMYNGGSLLLWDMVDGTPALICTPEVVRDGEGYYDDYDSFEGFADTGNLDSDEDDEDCNWEPSDELCDYDEY
jgi:hypothetical protein